jgi:hypothetical protein
MNKQQAEFLVVSAFERVLRGEKVEDSLIECKSSWPDPSKARQLAGHANQARGEEIIWIIGIDEKASRLTSPDSPDLAARWSQIGSRFDDNVIPDMFDLRVQVNESSALTALVFSTDRAPYVVKVGDAGGAVERDIPIRDGTRTRSAYRHEVVRLMHPSAVPPPAILVSAKLSGRVGMPNRPGVEFYLETGIYIDQRIDETVMLPLHLMKICISIPGGDEKISLEPSFVASPQGHNSGLGITRRQDGITIAGGATLSLPAHAFLNNAAYLDYSDTKFFELEIALGVSGAARPILAGGRIEVRRFQSPSGPTANRFGEWYLVEGGSLTN